MSLNVNIAEAKARLSELVQAAVRGEQVVIQRAGKPQALLVAIFHNPTPEEVAARIAKRRSAIGMYAHLIRGRDIEVAKLKLSEAQREDEHGRKFCAAD